MPRYFYFDYTYLLLIPAMIFAIVAQIKVKSNFQKYSEVKNSRSITGAEAARMILDYNGLNYVRIERVSGSLTDHYDPSANVVRLSDDVYSDASVASVGIAAHECGHVVQHSEHYFPIKVRTAIIPLTRIGSTLAFPLVIVGLVFSAFQFLISVGIFLFCFVVLFQAVTLPVEFNASNRAMKTLEEYHILADDELPMAKKVLGAAAMTYVAAMLSSFMSLLRLILLSNRRR